MAPSQLLDRRDLDFLLHDWLRVEELFTRERYAEHSRETVDDLMDLAQRLAEEQFAPHNQKADVEEPRLVDGRVQLVPEAEKAVRAFAEAGLVGASLPESVGGLQLPTVVANAVFAWFQAANVGTSSYPFLTVGNANLLLEHADDELVQRYVPQMVDGTCSGTMCLSEPQAGSSLADIVTRAEPQDDGTYRVTGTKMWISGGDHELTDNILHLVLCKVPGGPPGVKGISLVAVPKVLPDGTRNDVVCAGLNHKMGYRGTVNTVMAFGDGTHPVDGRDGAVGWLVGDEHRGLAYMFHMMNEARVGVGAGATALGYTGWLRSLDYARTRLQGRPATAKDPGSPQVPIVEHADVRRMLLAQKSYVEGALALVLYCGRLVDEEKTAPTPEARAEAHLLLDTLTPVAKSWPSQWCLAANDLAIQVHGGYGYTPEYGVEQLWRDNRLNPIHEGAHGIQALDLLGRKSVQQDGAGLRLLLDRMTATADALRGREGGAEHGEALRSAAERIGEVTAQAWASGQVDAVLAHATAYLEAVGHVVVAWTWAEQLLAVGDREGEFYDAKRTAADYFFRYELPRAHLGLDQLASLDRTVLDAVL